MLLMMLPSLIFSIWLKSKCRGEMRFLDVCPTSHLTIKTTTKNNWSLLMGLETRKNMSNVINIFGGYWKGIGADDGLFVMNQKMLIMTALNHPIL